MTVELPDEPKSRKEQYLADIAGQDVTLPAEPKSREEQYLAYIAENGGGGGGGTSDFDELINRPKYNGTAMTGETNIPLAPTVVQTPGASQTDVMSQNATTSMVFADPGTRNRVRIGNGSMTGNYSDSVAIGKDAQANGIECVVIGSGAGHGTVQAAGSQLVAIGRSAGVNMSNAKGTVSLGAYSKATRIGEVNVGSTDTSYGYNSTNYRVIGGVHDPVDAHDAATKGYVDGLVGNVASALNTINNGTQS